MSSWNISLEAEQEALPVVHSTDKRTTLDKKKVVTWGSFSHKYITRELVQLKYGDILSFFPKVLGPFCFSLTLRDSSKVAPVLLYLRFITCIIDYDIMFMYYKIEHTV